MAWQQVTRRIILGAFAVTLALPALGAKAEVIGPLDFGSALGFKAYCDAYGGVFTDTWDGNLWCQFPDGRQVVCDTFGHDCYIITVVPPPPSKEPELGIDPVTQGPNADSTLPSPKTGIADRLERQPSLMALEADQDQTISHEKGKKGKHRKHGKKGGKHRQR